MAHDVYGKWSHIHASRSITEIEGNILLRNLKLVIYITNIYKHIRGGHLGFVASRGAKDDDIDVADLENLSSNSL